jgi:glutathione S-transferase
MIILYGGKTSSAGRAQLTLEYSGVEYEYKPINPKESQARASLVSVNPSGRLPYLIDGDVRLQNAVAICFYIAEKYCAQIWSSSSDERSAIYDWSLWGITELDYKVRAVLGAPLADEDQHRTIQRLLDELETRLSGRGYLVGQRLTVADLIVGWTVSFTAASQRWKLQPYSQAWLQVLRSRPAWARVGAANIHAT